MPKPSIPYINCDLTHYEFFNEFTRQISVSDINTLVDCDKKFYEYRKLNYQRSTRLEKIFIPIEETKISKPQKWIVITESWCGDSHKIFL